MHRNLKTTPACGRATDIVLSALFGTVLIALTISIAFVAFALFHAAFGMSARHAAAATLLTWMCTMMFVTCLIAWLVHRTRDDNDAKIPLLDDEE